MSSKSAGRGIVKPLIFGLIVLLAPVALLAGGIEAVGYYRFHGMDQRIQIVTLEYARTGKMPPSLWKPHPIWHHGLNPDHEINHLNKFGFRGFDFPKQKRPSELRVICVGDSTTQGWPLPFDLAYPYFLERFLSVALKDRVVNVINAGIGSHLSAFNLSYLGNYLLDFSPDYVLIKSAYNDYAPFSYAAFEGDYTVAFPRIFDIETYPFPATFWTRHTYIGKYLVARRLMGTQVRMAVDGNFGGTSSSVIENNLKYINSYTSKIRAMAAAVSANGATPILLDLPVSEKPEYTPDWFRKIIGAFNGELDRVSREMKVKLIRTAPQVAGADFF
ncbi:MAG: SGNH/GDSL hydrolase family protein, partial [Nitrospinota bacterium]|nr:SGNH/GDSL hydrolase family protein [Nitrospinota bacterium]